MQAMELENQLEMRMRAHLERRNEVGNGESEKGGESLIQEGYLRYE